MNEDDELIDQKCTVCGRQLTKREYEECGNYCWDHNEELEERFFQQMHHLG